MAGLLSDVLPFLYSQGDRLKRQLGGLLSDPVGSVQQTLGGLLDSAAVQRALSDKAFANKQRPFQVTDKQAMGQMADNMLAGPLSFAPAGITVWHGSPHKFDKFDSSKIGTGEGAQAYGHGLYLAESPDVAKMYQDKLTDPAFKYVSQNQAKARINEKIAKRIEATDPERAAKLRADAASLSDPSGALYKVDLPDEHVAKMLDWDKPLSQQPAEIQDIFSGLTRFGVDDPMALTGKDAYRRMHEAAIRQGKPEPAAVKEAQMVRGLQKAGLPGVRYLDGGSRGAGQGTSNFVVFPGNEDILKILERNGIPLP